MRGEEIYWGSESLCPMDEPVKLLRTRAGGCYMWVKFKGRDYIMVPSVNILTRRFWHPTTLFDGMRAINCERNDQFRICIEVIGGSRNTEWMKSMAPFKAQSWESRLVAQRYSDLDGWKELSEGVCLIECFANGQRGVEGMPETVTREISLHGAVRIVTSLDKRLDKGWSASSTIYRGADENSVGFTTSLAWWNKSITPPMDDVELIEMDDPDIDPQAFQSFGSFRVSEALEFNPLWICNDQEMSRLCSRRIVFMMNNRLIVRNCKMETINAINVRLLQRKKDPHGIALQIRKLNRMKRLENGKECSRCLVEYEACRLETE